MFLFKKKYLLLTITFLFGTIILSPEIFAQKNKESSKKEREVEYYFTEGQKYYILEDYAKSYVLFQKALEIDRDNAAIHYKIAQILSKGDEIDKAIASIERALELEKNNKYYYLLAADLYTSKSNLDKAIEVYEKMLARIPETSEYLFDLAAIYLYKNDYDMAFETYEKIENIYGINEQTTSQKQKILLKQNKVDEAIEEGQKLIDNFPGIDHHVISLAEIMMSNKRYQSAIKVLEDLIRISPQNALARLVLSNAYKKTGDKINANKHLAVAFEDPSLDVNEKVKVLNEYLDKLDDPEMREFALELGKKIAEAHPDEAIVYTSLANIYLEINDREKAVENYNKSIRLDDSNFAVWQNILNLELQLGKLDSVIKHSDKALVLFPNQNSLYYYNGVAHFQKQSFSKAIESFEQGKKLTQSNQELRNIFNSILGDAYHEIGNHEKSDEAYETVLENDPSNSNVLNNYSYYLSLRKEKLEKAKQMSSKLVKMHPDVAAYLDTHAWVLYNLGEYKEAKKFLERALKSENANAIHHEHYGDVLYKLGDIDGAVKQWQIAKGMNSASDLIDKKIADRKLYE